MTEPTYPAPSFNVDEMFGMGAKRDLHHIYQRFCEEGMQHEYPKFQAKLVQDIVTETFTKRRRTAIGGMAQIVRATQTALANRENSQQAMTRLTESADWSDLLDTVTDTVPGDLSFSSMGSSPSDVAPLLWAGEDENLNFRPKRRADIDSFPDLLLTPEDGESEDKVEPHPRYWSTQTRNYSRKFMHSWQARLNDGIGLLADQAVKMAKAATRTMARRMANAMLFNWNSIDGNQMWNLATHVNVATNGLTGVNLASATLLEQLIWLMLNQVDQQHDWETDHTNPLPTDNMPKYIVTGLNQWTIVWDLLNNDMLPNAAGTLNVPNPLRKYKAMGLTPIWFRYLGNSPNVYLFCDKSQYQPAFTYTYLRGANKTPIVMYKDDGWKVVSGSNMLVEYDTLLKMTYQVNYLCELNVQPWEGTAAIIPAFAARQ